MEQKQLPRWRVSIKDFNDQRSEARFPRAANEIEAAAIVKSWQGSQVQIQGVTRDE